MTHDPDPETPIRLQKFACISSSVYLCSFETVEKCFVQKKVQFSDFGGGWNWLWLWSRDCYFRFRLGTECGGTHTLKLRSWTLHGLPKYNRFWKAFSSLQLSMSSLIFCFFNPKCIEIQLCSRETLWKLLFPVCQVSASRFCAGHSYCGRNPAPP
jgi:hypothetical protein